MTTIALIAAVSEDGFIGRKGAIPWRVKGDWQFFKRQSLGKPNIMGRITFETLPEALPGRENIVVTRQNGWTAKGVTVRHDVAEAIAYAKTRTDGEIMVIGGEAVYREALPAADTIYLTTVHTVVGDGDARFPAFDKKEWSLAAEERHKAAPGDTADYTIRTYTRVR
jgi:dihydrofolate reductase